MENKVEVNVKYEAGHSYDKAYEKTEYFCPYCGKQSVWVECSEGDFYEGPSHYCIECESEFTMPSGPYKRTDNWQDRQIIDAIRKAVK